MIRKYELLRRSPDFFEVECLYFDVDSRYIGKIVGCVEKRSFSRLSADFYVSGYDLRREIVDFISKLQSLIAGTLTVDYLNGIRRDVDGIPFND